MANTHGRIRKSMRVASRYSSSTSSSSTQMANTRGRISKSMTVALGRSTSTHSKSHPDSVWPRHRPTTPQCNSPTEVHSSQVTVDCDRIKQNVLRLFFQAELAPESFTMLYENATDDPDCRSFIKLGVCCKLSASAPGSDQRTRSLPLALNSLCRRLRAILGDQHQITKGQDEFISRLQRQFEEITALPSLATLTSEGLYRKLLHVFAPEDSGTREEVMASLPARCPSDTREHVGLHLESSYRESCYSKVHMETDSTCDPDYLISQCLNVDYDCMYYYCVGKAPRTSTYKGANQDRNSELTEDWGVPLVEKEGEEE